MSPAPATSNSNHHSNSHTNDPASSNSSNNNNATTSPGANSLLNRKYLCSAPRPDQFEELSDRVVSQILLGNDNNNIQKMILGMIERLQRMHHLKPRIGPGRKSNAEHALAFYEYLLEHLQQASSSAADKKKPKIRLHTEEEEENGSASLSEEEEEENENDQKSKDPLERIVHDDACHVCCEAVSQTIKTNDQESQQKQQRSRLILSCDTCRLVFHPECYRPKLFVTMDPENLEFRCSYCILADSKKNSKERRQAAAAVRLMARLRQQSKRRQQQQQQEDSGTTNANEEAEKKNPQYRTPVKLEQEETIAMEVDEETTEQGNHDDEERSESSSTHKRPLSPQVEGKKPTGRCSKRPRRQPTLFDPQASSPASRWQTDELQEWKMKQHEEECLAALQADKQHKHQDNADKDDKRSNADTDQDEEADLHKHEAKAKQTSSAAVLRSGKRDNDSVWCNFCRDDPEIAICVFCACRKCFGKHHESKLLLCDKCDEEYHSFCLEPPLKALPPKSKPWFCPSCAKETTNNASGDPVRSNTRKRESIASSATSPTTNIHSPRSLRNHPSTTHAPNNTSSGRTNNATNPVIPKRVSARQVEKKANAASPDKSTPPPRQPTPPSTPQPVPNPVTTVYKKKGTGRPRGRPPKNKNKTTADSTPSNTQKSAPVLSVAVFQGPRKRGRPPKAETLARRAQEAAENAARKPDARNKAKASSGGGGTDSKSSATASSKGKASAVQSSSSSAQKASSAATVSIVVPIATSVPVAVSRSGRTVKRLKPFEEIAEGQQQHLKAPLRPIVNVVPPTVAGNVQSAATTVESTPVADAGPSSKLPTSAIVAAAPIVSGSDPSKAQALVSQPLNQSILPQPQQLATSSMQPPAGKPFPITTPTSALVGVTPTVPAVANESTVLGATMSEVALDREAHEITSIAAAPKMHITPSGYATTKVPRRKPGARECMQISRRFGVKEIPQEYMDILLDYCTRGKVEHLIRMRERLDDHSRFLELQLAGLEALVKERGESNVTVPLAPPSPGRIREGDKS